MLSVAVFLVFIVVVATSKWGSIKLGPDHSEPQYSFVSWFAMLFSAGYGIALLFFGVAEPVLHYAMPHQGAGQTLDAARQAMQITFLDRKRVVEEQSVSVRVDLGGRRYIKKTKNKKKYRQQT